MGTPPENIPQSVGSDQYSVYSGQYSVGKVRFAGIPVHCGSRGRDWFLVKMWGEGSFLRILRNDPPGRWE
jgi:hypothetical protein